MSKILDSKINMKDVILLPTYNEYENIQWIIPKIFDTVPDVYIMVIDDNSPDGTAKVVKELMLKYKRLSILERKCKTGLGNAYKDGIQRILKDPDVYSVITMDADGSHDPKYLIDFLELIRKKKYDMVIGSRYIKDGGIEDWEFWRKKLSSLGNLYARFWTGLRVRDITAGFTCVKRDFLDKIDFSEISSGGYAFIMEYKFYMFHKLSANIKEVPIIFKSRREGESKINNFIIREGLKIPISLFFYRVKNIWKMK